MSNISISGITAAGSGSFRKSKNLLTPLSALIGLVFAGKFYTLSYHNYFIQQLFLQFNIFLFIFIVFFIGIIFAILYKFLIYDLLFNILGIRESDKKSLNTSVAIGTTILVLYLIFTFM